MRVSLLCSVASVFLASAAVRARRRRISRHAEGPRRAAGANLHRCARDAPDDLKTAGKYTTGKRVDAVGSVMGKSYERPTGVSLPFKGQPLQGHSGIKVMPDGSFWVLTDNGMGSRYNSADSMLYLNRHKIDWATGKIDRQETIFLHDPDKKVPFRILHEDTAKRYLTGADFDTEGFQIDRRHLLDRRRVRPLCAEGRQDRQDPGRVRNHGRRQAGALARSLVGAVAGRTRRDATPTVNLRRSKGYEGFAASKDGKFLYGLLEGPLWDAEKKDC